MSPNLSHFHQGAHLLGVGTSQDRPPGAQPEPCRPKWTRHASRPIRPPSSSNPKSLLPSPCQMVELDNAALASGHTPAMLPGLQPARTVDGPRGVLRVNRPELGDHDHPISSNHRGPPTNTWKPGPPTPQAQIFQPRWAGVPPDAPLPRLRPYELRTPQQFIGIGRLPRGGPSQ